LRKIQRVPESRPNSAITSGVADFAKAPIMLAKPALRIGSS
jgi:hypothetical protein